MPFSTKDKRGGKKISQKINKKREKGAFVSKFNTNMFFKGKKLFLPSLCQSFSLLCFPTTPLHKSATVICSVVTIYCFHSTGNTGDTFHPGDKVSVPENTPALLFHTAVWYWICFLTALHMCCETREAPVKRPGGTCRTILPGLGTKLSNVTICCAGTGTIAVEPIQK